MLQVKSILFIAILSMAFSGCRLFEEPQKLPVVKIASASNITSSSFRIVGKIESSENHSKKGFFLGTQTNPSEGSGTELVVDSFGNDFSLSVIKLSADTRYYIRAFARNGTGIGYSENKEITTLPGVCPTVNTKPLIITGQEIKSGGSITDNGGMPILAKGICWSASGDPSLGQGNFTSENGDGDDFSSTIPVFNPAQNIFIRAYATNAKGTCYGEVFRSRIDPPTVNTVPVSGITYLGVITGGNISSDGGASITSKGICWSTSPNPSLETGEVLSFGSGSNSFSSNISGLEPFTTYYVCAYATNSSGTGYGIPYSFRTKNLTDIENNIYQTIKIGTQVWMKENLKVKRYRNGDFIPSSPGIFSSLGNTNGACGVYNNNTANASIYGNLYNWYAVADTRGLCPTGWHIPDKSEWEVLRTYLGGSTTGAGGAMKTIGTLQAGNGFWEQPNYGATNSSGFSALPGGSAKNTGFELLGIRGYWWTSSQDFAAPWPESSWHFLLQNDVDWAMFGSFPKLAGFSVRCVMD